MVYWLLVALLLSFPFYQGKAQQVVVPVHIQIPLLLKVVSLENSVSSGNDRYIVGIIFQNTYQESREIKDQILLLEGKRELALLDGTPVHFIPLDISSTKNIEDIVSNKQINAVYISPLRSVDLKTITAATKTSKILSMTGVPEYVEEGVSVGIGIEGEKPEILINLVASNDGGVEFSSKILSLARIVH